MYRFRPTKPAFFLRDAQELGRDLLGRVLLHETPSGTLSAIIVETEAYDETDPASHSCHGRTDRNQMMFEAGGHAYIYRSYGMHWCLNVAAGKPGFGSAVLIRALKPIAGLEHMRKNRQVKSNKLVCDRDLCRGPGRLCQALGLSGTQNGVDMITGTLRFVTPTGFRKPPVLATPRIGISKAIDTPWRFCIPYEPYVSGPKRLREP